MARDLDSIDFEFDPSEAVPKRPAFDLSSASFMTGLNDRQREAVTTTDGPLMVLAGAGSGKTKMLTSRIAYLVEAKGTQPSSILAMTFTNKAAGEMRERVATHLSQSRFYGTPEIGTFHSVCVRLLRREMLKTPFTKPFVIYDDSDQLSLIKSVLEKLNIDEKSFNPKSFQHAINRAKCDALEPHDLRPAPHNVFDKKLVEVYGQYQTDLFANNALDFGEIICMVYRIFRDNPDTREKYQRLYKYIHVDEYQDTNRAQYLLLSMLASPVNGGHANICVVGDEDQSIYKWRGADINNILDFEKEYPGAAVVKLEQNYRSTKNIITAASQVIKNNRSRKDKTLWTANPTGTPIVAYQVPDERAEAETVISEIRRLAREDGYSYSEFAIFYRTNAQSRQFEDALRREKISYRIYGGLRFYDRKEIKDIMSYFKLVLNPEDSVSIKRVINVPARGIGKTTIEKIDALFNTLQASGEKDATYWAALRRASMDASITNAGTAKKLAQFVTLIDRLIVEQAKLTLCELYHLILDETGYVRDLRQEGNEEALSRIENLEELETIIQEFEEDVAEKKLVEDKAGLLPLFLEQSALATDTDKTEDKSIPAVNLMTLHSSKGLEFPVVFLGGMEEGLFPSIKAWEETPEEDIEEERRLCYVGMTRARKQLFLLHAAVRRIWGNINYQERARFFSEMPDDLIEFKDLSYGMAAVSFRPGSSRTLNSSFSSAPQTVIRRPASAGSSGGSTTTSGSSGSLIGDKMEHPEYGLGTVISSEGTGEDQKIMVEFKGRDRKKFLLRYVREFISKGGSPRW